MTRIISALLLATMAAWATAADVASPAQTKPVAEAAPAPVTQPAPIQAAKPAEAAKPTEAAKPAGDAPKLIDNPPERHIVVRGDTLWGIAGKFLKEPWRWPEIWRMNKEEIKNPHLIYPGDVVILDMSDGKPRLKIGKSVKRRGARSGTVKLEPQTYSESLEKEIPSIPPNAIEPFISQPLIIEADSLDKAPRIVATQEDRVFLGNGDEAFVTGIEDTNTLHWQVYRPGKPLKDPETDKVIGYEAFFLGNVKLIQGGSPAIVRIQQAKEEIGRGDRLVPAAPPTLASYVPRRPELPVDGRVMSIYGGVQEGGRYSIVSINRGTMHDMEVGHVVALYRNRVATDKNEETGQKITVTLPEDRYALAFIFRTFERVSYALVMEASRPVIVNDMVKNP